jgi:hypothetical protein
VVQSVKTGPAAELIPTDSKVEYAPPVESGDPGYVLYLKGGTLMAHPCPGKESDWAGSETKCHVPGPSDGTTVAPLAGTVAGTRIVEVSTRFQIPTWIELFTLSKE